MNSVKMKDLNNTMKVGSQHKAGGFNMLLNVTVVFKQHTIRHVVPNSWNNRSNDL